MGAFNKVTKDSLDAVQINAGMILNTFSPTAPQAPTANSIVCATTGGITASCVPTFEDFGADIDNCPNNTKELKRITGWECTLSFTAVEVTAETIILSLGAASNIRGEIIADSNVMNTYFKDIWFVSERVDDKIVAIKLKNAISTGGLQLKTQKNGKGQLTVTLTGHISISDETKVPMEFYICTDSGIATTSAATTTSAKS